MKEARIPRTPEPIPCPGCGLALMGIEPGRKGAWFAVPCGCEVEQSDALKFGRLRGGKA